MHIETVEPEEIALKLRQACVTAGGPKAWSDANGVGKMTVYRILNEDYAIPDNIAAKFGYERLTVYVKKRR